MSCTEQRLLAFRGLSLRPPLRQKNRNRVWTCKLYVRVLQERPEPRHTAVLVHDFLTDSRLFARLTDIQELSDCRLLAVDLRGHGYSPPPSDAYSHADDIRTAAGDERVHLVGVGFGGIHSLEASFDCPLVRSVSVIGSGLPGHAWPQSAYTHLELEEDPISPVVAFIKASGAWRDTLENAAPDVVAELKAMVRSYSGFHFTQPDLEIRATIEPLSLRLKDVPVRVLAGVGERDDEQFRAIAKEIHRGVKRTAFDEHVVFEKTGHFATLENPHQVARTLREFWELIEKDEAKNQLEKQDTTHIRSL